MGWRSRFWELGTRRSNLVFTNKFVERKITMIRKLFQSVLCFILCPLLVAQQMPTPALNTNTQQSSVPDFSAEAPRVLPELSTIPQNTKIDLIAREPQSLAAVTTGSAIRLSVASDVVVNGVTAIRAGTPVIVTITDERRGSHKMHRDGSVTIRARELHSGRPILINLSGKFSAERKEERSLRDEPIRSPNFLKIGLVAAVVMATLGLIGFAIGGD